MIDFSRAIQNAWERTLIILFQPFDIGKWGLMGFIAFLALLAEGGVSINNPIPNTNNNASFQYNSVPQALHAFKQFTTWLGGLPDDPQLKFMLCFGATYVVVWLVLNWVGCRAEFVLLDNIVRNRAALAGPWQRYGREGNFWFIFHLGLILLSFLFAAMAVGAFLFLNWTWISAARDPAGAEIATVVLTLLVFVVLGVIGAVIQFLIQTLVLPLYFKQTLGLGGALMAVLTLVLTRPISIFLYLLLSLALAILSGLVACLIFVAAFCATLTIVCWVSCFPFIGAMLVSMILCQLILPLIVFQRCFQLSVLEEFGPQYDVFNVDQRPAPPAGY